MTELIQIGSAKALPGQRGFGEILIAHRSDGSSVYIPIILIRGQADGPVVCLSGGIHGNEYASIEAATRLARELEPDALKGTLVVAPIVNQPSFDDADFVSHFDHVNLNRAFPGSPTGRLTDRIADAFLNQVVSRCDALIDLHAAGFSRIAPLVIAQGDYLDQVKDLALATGFDLIWLGGPWKGAARIAALDAGLAAITIEAGGGMICDPDDVKEHTQAVRSVLRHLGMLEGSPRRAHACRVVTGGTLHSASGGFFRPLCRLGMDVVEDQVLAEITDPHGKLLDEIRSPGPGIALMIREVPAVRPGDELFIIGEVVETWESLNGS